MLSRTCLFETFSVFSLRQKLKIEVKMVFDHYQLGVLIILIYILVTIKVSKITKVTSQALYKKNLVIKEKKKKINESSDVF